MSDELHIFIKESLSKGIDRPDIKKALLEGGWREDEIEKALSSFAQVDFPLPVPRRKPYLEARSAFIYLVSFITLYISAFSFGSLVFQFVDIWFPDPLSYSYYPGTGFGGMRYALAALIVAFPLHLFLMSLIAKSHRKDPEQRQSKLRRWLIYITLVVVSGVLIGDFIAVLAHVLGGELAARFLLKALTVMLISGAIFGYYLGDLQKEEKEK